MAFCGKIYSSTRKENAAEMTAAFNVMQIYKRVADKPNKNTMIIQFGENL